jgi:hypothetical protein
MQAVLGSWKEIANYLGKGVRTVQRWERCSGLPVHRPSGSSKGVVLAFPTELDKWARRQDGRKNGTEHVPSPLQIQRNLALSNELMAQTRMLRDSTRELMKTCNQFLELSRRHRNEATRRGNGFTSLEKAG